MKSNFYRVIQHRVVSNCIHFFFTGLFIYLSLSTSAQTLPSSTAALAEKIYLKTDSELYTNNQTIWLNFIVTEAATNRPTDLSGVLYVELIDAEGNIRDEKMVKLHVGFGRGTFDLGSQYLPGRYLIRAYTAWNRNFDQSFIAKKYIDIYPASEEKSSSPIQHISLVERSPGELLLKADFIPQQIDSLHQKKLDVFIVLDGKKDSLSLKESPNKQYQLVYPVSQESRLVSLGMKTSGQISYSKTVALKEPLPNLSFYPESGYMITGVFSKVAFRATDVRGRGVQINGEIYDDKENLLTHIASNKLGMGSFVIRPDSARTYYAKFHAVPDSTQTYLVDLPIAKSEGKLLRVTKFRDQFMVASISSSPSQDSTYIQVSSRGNDYFYLKGILKNGQMTATLPADLLPEGVIAFTLLDDSKIPQSRRLAFNHHPEARLKIHSNMDSSFYTKRVNTELSIKVTDANGQAIPSKVSVLVVNQDLRGNSLFQQGNILSELLLSSDFIGEIEQPGYYFDSDYPERLNELDVLLMSQTTDTYPFSSKKDSLHIAPESTLKVSGTVNGVFSSNKTKEGIELTMMTFGENTSLYTQNTDSVGQFYFNLPDTYGQYLNILLQTKTGNGKSRNYSVKLDKRDLPEIIFDQAEAIENIDSVDHFLVRQLQEKNAVENAIKFSGDYMELEGVSVEDYSLTPQRKKVFDRFGKPDVVINGQDIEEKEEKWSYGLYSVLLFNYPDKLRIERVGGAGGFLLAKALNGEMTLVLVDGEPVLNFNYQLIPNIPPSEVKSVELIEYVGNFTSLFTEVFPQVNPMYAPAVGNIIAIYTKGGTGILSVQKADGILKVAIPVFSAEREFEAPDYSRQTEQDWKKPDLRSLIHWEPNKSTDEEGNTTINYYNADIPGKMLIIIEAISEDGSIGYREVSYEVREK